MNTLHTSRVYTFGGRTYDLSSRTYVMGILNVTPDSFSDGGKYLRPADGIRRGLAMAEEGADFIDIGGESTRPKSSVYGDGAVSISADEELARVIPVIEGLRRQTDVPLSIDTTKAAVAREALSAGAVIVNDVSGFTLDPEMAPVAAAAGATAIVMHMKGTPQTMQSDPRYDDLFGEIEGALAAAIRVGRDAGIRQLVIDPGIGFGKLPKHNLALLAGLRRFTLLGCPLLVGPSRKSFLGSLLDLPVEQRLEGSLAAAVACILNGANILRVHDVRETVRAAKVADAIKDAGEVSVAGTDRGIDGPV